MSSAKLRKIGGSVMVAIPPTILDSLKLQSGATVEVAVEGQRIAITPANARRYSLAQLLAKHEAMPRNGEDQDWTCSKPQGNELI